MNPLRLIAGEAVNPSTSKTLYRRNADILTANVDHEVVMMGVQAGSYYGIGGTGTMIWKLLAEPKSLDELIDHIAADYDVERERCASDISSFVEELLGLNLIEAL